MSLRKILKIKWKTFKRDFYGDDPLDAFLALLLDWSQPTQETNSDPVSVQKEKSTNASSGYHRSHNRFHSLNDKLLEIVCSDGQKDVWTLRDAVRGVQIFGGIGSGKSSGSGQTLAQTYLKMGYGGVILTAKVGEVEEWIEFFEKAGRPLEDLIVFEEPYHGDEREPFPEYFFNPLEYQKETDAGDTFNLTNLIMTIYKMGKSFTGGGSGNSGDRYWDDMLQLTISRMIDLLRFKGESITIANMRKIMTTAPNTEKFDDYERRRDRMKKSFKGI